MKVTTSETGRGLDAEMPLTLGVPTSTCRPGDTPDFSDLMVSEAGEIRAT